MFCAQQDVKDLRSILDRLGASSLLEMPEFSNNTPELVNLWEKINNSVDGMMSICGMDLRSSTPVRSYKRLLNQLGYNIRGIRREGPRKKQSWIYNVFPRIPNSVPPFPYLKSSQDNADEKYLRKWQKQEVINYHKKMQTEKYYLTSAYQGSGKTLFAVMCFLAYVMDDTSFVDLSLNDISTSSYNKKEHFPIIFVPNNSIKNSTIKTWSQFGITINPLSNKELQETSPAQLIKHGIDGLVITYQQVTSNGKCSVQYPWRENIFVRFIERSPEIQIHGILDECHKLTIADKYIKIANLTAAFFIANENPIKTLHLLTGTPVKVGGTGLKKSSITNKIPFARYDKRNNIIPDTFHGIEEAINDRDIVWTQLYKQSIIEGIIQDENGEEIQITKEMIDDFFDNPRGEESKKTERIYQEVYKSVETWRCILPAGDKLLEIARKEYPKAIGIIFAPSVESAKNIHRYILSDRSVLCISNVSKKKFESCNHVTSKDIRQWLEVNQDKIDWIVSCEAIAEGFDYPNCKVSIIYPQLFFLSLIKIGQMIGRTNRTIQNYPNIKAYCLIPDCKPIEDLATKSQSSKFGICPPDSLISQVLNDLTDRKIIEHDQSKNKATPPELNIVSVEMSDAIVVDNQEDPLPQADQEQDNEQDDINVRSLAKYIEFKKSLEVQAIKYLSYLCYHTLYIAYHKDEYPRIPGWQSFQQIVYLLAKEEYNYLLNFDNSFSCEKIYNDCNHDIAEILSDFRMISQDTINLAPNGSRLEDIVGCIIYKMLTHLNPVIKPFAQTKDNYWAEIVYSDNDNTDMIPEEPGVYAIVHNNNEILYIGQSGNLLRRISDRIRYENAKWIPSEGKNSLVVKWFTCPNCEAIEKLLINKIKPTGVTVGYKKTKTTKLKCLDGSDYEQFDRWLQSKLS